MAKARDRDQLSRGAAARQVRTERQRSVAFEYCLPPVGETEDLKARSTPARHVWASTRPATPRGSEFESLLPKVRQILEGAPVRRTKQEALAEAVEKIMALL